MGATLVAGAATFAGAFAVTGAGASFIGVLFSLWVVFRAVTFLVSVLFKSVLSLLWPRVLAAPVRFRLSRVVLPVRVV